MTRYDRAMSQYDSPWKEAIERYFRAFLEFFFPLIAAEIDWTRDTESLEQELHKLRPRAKTGKRIADKLIKAFTTTDDTRHLHVEIQGDPDDAFTKRVHVYNYRAEDHLEHTVVSVAVLTDDDPTWRPTAYEFSCWGCERGLKFVAVKVLDWAGREAELAAHENPFALFVLAHLLSGGRRRTWRSGGRANWG